MIEQMSHRNQLVSLAILEHVLVAAREVVSGEAEPAADDVVAQPEARQQSALAQQPGLAAYLKRSEQERGKLAEKRQLAKQEAERRRAEKQAKTKI